MLNKSFANEESKVSYRPRTRWRTFGWQLFTLACCTALSAHFAYHTLAGRYGMHARTELQSRLMILEFEAESLKKARSDLRNEIALLSPDTPHADLVEEIARDVLGYAHPGDRIYRVR